MKVSELYSYFNIPPNLQRHMLEVSAVAEFITQNWTGPRVNSELIIQSCLVHDLGNLVKFKRPFLGDLEAQAGHWEEIQAQMIQKYGNNAQRATEQMLQEIKISPKIIEIVKLFPKVARERDEFPWEVRICNYADMSVSPDGIVGYEKRMADLLIRYQQEPESTWEITRENAEMVKPNISSEVLKVSAEYWKTRIESLQNTEIAQEI